MIYIFTDILKKEIIKKNEPLKNHCTFKTGGLCEYFLTPESMEKFTKVIEICRKNGIPFFVLGNGSNLLFTDDFHKGAYISTVKLCDISEENGIITAGCGAKLSSVCNFAASLSLSGLEELSGIPGTLGGAVCMNAGAYGGEIKNVIKTVKYVDTDGEIITVTGDECNFGYRQSIFTDGQKFIVSAELELKKDDKSAISERMADFRKRRCDKQPLAYPSAGSTFKRPEGYFAGALIEQAGLKGCSIGGAAVSDLHAGFVINCGDATAKDVLDLISHIQKTVYDKFGVKLEPEVRILGE